MTLVACFIAFVLIGDQWYPGEAVSARWKTNCFYPDAAMCQFHARKTNEYFHKGNIDADGRRIDKVYAFCAVPQ